MSWKFFQNNRLANKNEVKSHPVQKLKIAVAAFEDNCRDNSGLFLAQKLAENPLYQVTFYNELIDKKFLNLQGRNFFDLVDAGNQVLIATKCDVLIWGFREKDKIRLNFQTKKQYEINAFMFFSVLNSLYVPLLYFQQQQLPLSMQALIEGAILAAAPVFPGFDKKNLLQVVVENISSLKTPEGLGFEFRPYILNILAIVYLQAKGENINSAEIKMVARFLGDALKSLRSENQKLTNDNLLMGNIYSNFGQLFQLAAETTADKRFFFSRKAVQSFQAAQKYFNRYAFPYDFGFNAYRLSKLYFSYWKQTSDVQALRDAVFYLRETEKIFSNILFPHVWAQIQGDLGFYLSLLGMFGNSDEISMRAVESYKNRQRIFTKELKPYDWAKTEENIGNIFYNSGKRHDDEEYIEEALKYYSSAGEVYENYSFGTEQKQIQVCIAKANEILRRLSR